MGHGEGKGEGVIRSPCRGTACRAPTRKDLIPLVASLAGGLLMLIFRLIPIAQGWGAACVLTDIAVSKSFTVASILSPTFGAPRILVPLSMCNRIRSPASSFIT